MKKAIIFISGILLLGACKKNSSTETYAQNGKMELRMTDSPADYEELNIQILRAEAHSSNGDTLSGWSSLNIKPGIYNILKLRNGLDTLLGTAELPVGTISQIRLILGDACTIKTGGNTYTLEVPSSYKSGLKLQVHAEIQAGITYKLLFDFDAAKSVVETGNNKYKLKPVIRTITEATSGAIKGDINPDGINSFVYAVSGTDTFSTYPTSQGQFLLKGVKSGNVQVHIVPQSNYKDSTINTTVTNGLIKDLGIIQLHQ